MNNKNKIKATVFSVLFFMLGSVFAANAATQGDIALAKKVVLAIHATDQFDNFLPGVAAAFKTQLTTKDPNNASLIAKVVDQEALKIANDRAELDDDAAKVYANHFTTPELKAIYDFYTSSAGKKLLTTAPETIGDLMKAFELWSNKITEQLKQNVNKVLASSIKKK